MVRGAIFARGPTLPFKRCVSRDAIANALSAMEGVAYNVVGALCALRMGVKSGPLTGCFMYHAGACRFELSEAVIEFKHAVVYIETEPHRTTDVTT